MTLHEKIDYIMANMGGNGGSTDYLDIWEHGRSYGFSAYYTSNASGNKWTKFYYLPDHIHIENYAKGYGRIVSNYMFYKPVDLTNVKKLELEHWMTGIGDYWAFGVSKTAKIEAPLQTDALLYQMAKSSGQISATNNTGALQTTILDVSSLSGEYYIYIGIDSSGPSGVEYTLNFYINHLRGLYK